MGTQAKWIARSICLIGGIVSRLSFRSSGRGGGRYEWKDWLAYLPQPQETSCHEMWYPVLNIFDSELCWAGG